MITFLLLVTWIFPQKLKKKPSLIFFLCVFGLEERSGQIPIVCHHSDCQIFCRAVNIRWLHVNQDVNMQRLMFLPPNK